MNNIPLSHYKNIKVNPDGTISPIDPSKPSKFSTLSDSHNIDSQIDEILDQFNLSLIYFDVDTGKDKNYRPDFKTAIKKLLTDQLDRVEAEMGALEKPQPQEEVSGKQVVKLCEYRGHLCQIVEEYGDNEYDLKLLAEMMVGGGFGECDCAREHFLMVQVYPHEIVTAVSDLASNNPEANTDVTNPPKSAAIASERGNNE